MATLSSSERHSIGDLTLYSLKFTTISTTDAYSISNMAGAVGAFISSWGGTTTLNTMSITYTNSSTGVSLTLCGGAAVTGTVYLLGHG
jgi:hypothetical protein